MSKRRKIWLALGLLGAFFIGWPTVNAFVIRRQVVRAVQGAESVRLEEFAFHAPLASVELPRAAWPEVAAHLPMVPDVGVPGIVKACFIPHHRIVVTGPDRQTFTLTVCFPCGQATAGRSGIFALPYFWVGPLRTLFTSHGLRIRRDQEYNDTALEPSPP